MLFPKNIAGKVARGEATLTIRPATARPPSHGARRCVKVTQRGAVACHITIVDVEEILAGEVTYKQAKACGFRTTAAFKESWIWIHDKEWAERYPDVTPDDYEDRFAQRHAHRPVYAITFKLAVDTPRFLAHPTPNSGDYTEQRHRAIDDLEVVDDLTQERYAKKAREEGERRRASFKRDLERERALRKAERGRSMRLPPYMRRAA